MIDIYNSLPKIKNQNVNNTTKNEVSLSNDYNYRINQMEQVNKRNSNSLDTYFRYNESKRKSSPPWENQSESDNSFIISTNDFSYRNEKKYYQLLEKHRIKQDKIKKLSTRTSIDLLNNEFGIKNREDTSNRLPKITKTSYQVLSGFCQKNCPLQSAKDIINVDFNDNFEREYKKKNKSNKNHYYKLKKTISLPLPETKKVNNSINHEIKDLEDTIIQKSLKNLVNCARRTGRGLFCGV